MDYRIGQGFDVHQLVNGRSLWLGGVNIPYSQGLRGHSDADVALHALIDALLGAASLNDIGHHFPDTDNSFKDIDSRIMLRKTHELLQEKGYEIGNVDVTIIAQAPKIAPYRQRMIETIASDLQINPEQVSVKGTTTEHLGFTGRGEGIAAMAICMLKIKD